ncbi:MAG TPA: hypothetical protein VFC78_10445 [Tepidisphaeraceae bacterium]|nr:hypothetical protein [Tepidisphaeraceae bacterium]
MPKKIALVGHCGPDSSYLRMTLSGIERGVQILSADDDASLQRALEGGVDLVLFNRVLDYGFEDTQGVAIIGKLHKCFPSVKMMLISNYPEAQAAAVAAGALPGFGKRDLGSPRVKQLLRDAIFAEAKATAASAALTTRP